MNVYKPTRVQVTLARRLISVQHERLLSKQALRNKRAYRLLSLSTIVLYHTALTHCHTDATSPGSLSRITARRHQRVWNNGT